MCIRDSPREEETVRSEIISMCQRLGDQISISTEPGIISVSKSKYCVTFFSAIAIEAFALNVRVIALNILKENWPVRLSKIGIAEEASSGHELIQLLSNDQPKPSDQKLEYLRDGRSAIRLHETIDRFCSKKESTPSDLCNN